MLKHILNNDIRNTRFILTIIAMAMFCLAILGDVVLVVVCMDTGKAVDATLFTVFTTAVGLLSGLLSTSYNSYFKGRETIDNKDATCGIDSEL
jgi:predicted membrane channel-forming protein YqfA (hemolysin III family)